MKSFIFSFFERIGLADDDRFFLISAYERLGEENQALLSSLVDKFYAEPTLTIVDAAAPLTEVAAATDIPRYTLHLLFCAVAHRRLLPIYEEKGLEEARFWDAALDLRAKCEECRKQYGIVGISALAWYGPLFRLERFSFGRLQYAKWYLPLEQPYEKFGLHIDRKTLIPMIHIPSLGPLPKEERIESYKLAYQHFRGTMGFGDVVAFGCGTWLIYPPTVALCKEGSNMRSFAEDFEILVTKEEELPRNATRVFGCNYNGDVTYMPRRTSLQRSLADYLAAGNKMGVGFCIIPFDGEKILR
jgi:hypothetical protein